MKNPDARGMPTFLRLDLAVSLAHVVFHWNHDMRRTSSGIETADPEAAGLEPAAKRHPSGSLHAAKTLPLPLCKGPVSPLVLRGLDFGDFSDPAAFPPITVFLEVHAAWRTLRGVRAIPTAPGGAAIVAFCILEILTGGRSRTKG